MGVRDSLDFHEAVWSGSTNALPGGGVQYNGSDRELLQELVDRLGGPHAVVEQISFILDAAQPVGAQVPEQDVDEDTLGYCYLRLFDRVEHRDAKHLGAWPSVAEVRRFSNGRADPFGLRSVSVLIGAQAGNRVAHIRYTGGESGLRPVSALAALAKDCRVGGNVDAGELWNVANLDAFGKDECGVPADLPFNVPDAVQYPFARYRGLADFVRKISNSEAWNFLVHLGARRDETPSPSFLERSFPTTLMLEAYFMLRGADREVFVQTVVWVRDPIPGRPGGVQPTPPPWPQNIPTPVHHAMTRYAGLAEWVATLPDPWQVVSRQWLFGVREPFSPVWWSDYHKTASVYMLYSRVSNAMRESFDSGVYWIPDAEPWSGEQATADEQAPGYCYLAMVAPDYRAVAMTELGFNPPGVAVGKFLRAMPGGISGTKHKVVYPTGFVGYDGIQQAHIVGDAEGDDALTLCESVGPGVLFGATTDLNAMIEPVQEKIAVKETVFPTLPIGGGAGMELSFNMFALLGKDIVKYPSINFNILQEPAFLMLLGTFESVQLIGASFRIEVSTGSQNSVWAAVTGPGVNLDNEADWLSTPLSVRVNGSDQGHVTGAMVLPYVHPFEKELRAVSLVGNPPPSFRFSFSGTATGTGNVKGQFIVRVRGQYPLGHVRVGSPKVAKSLRQHADRLLTTLAYRSSGRTSCPNAEGEEDDDDEDESENEAPARPSPPRANASSPRSVVK